ncbi:MAG TPA: hypothetical protein PLR99_09415 [Polyangiaceae bacterium]|jgi:hypothetical protein|nr:hypothetical protein [Polyangiaceae bacterium]
MRFTLPLALLGVTVAVAACSSTTSTSDGGTAPTATTTGTTPTATPDASATSTGTTPPALPPPASFAVTVGTCTETPPCGGSLEGTWDYSAACAPDTAFSEVTKACPTATLTKLSGTASGRLTIVGSSLTRKGTLALKAEINVPTECATPAGGCSGLATAIKAAGVKSATCAAGAGGSCDCTIENDVALDKTGTTFTTNGNTLVTSDGSEYSYCVAGSKLTHKQTKAGKPADEEIGVYEATKR